MSNKETITVKPLHLKTVSFKIIGTAPLVMNKFAAKAREQMKHDQELGAVAKTKKSRQPKDFDELYNSHRHISEEGWDGIPAMAIKNAMVRASKAAGFEMVTAKIAFKVHEDGFDRDDLSPLVKITKGTPQRLESYVNIQRTVDIISRPMWSPGWEANVSITYDADLLAQDDVANLLYRAGQQVGICAGRPASSSSSGQNWGTFRIAQEGE